MKKAAVILLSVFILLQSGIMSLQYVVKLRHHKSVVHNNMKMGLFNSQLISFNISELFKAEWENDHEFFLNGEKYDVVKCELKNDAIQYICINDKTEKNLINNIAKSEKKSNLIEELFKKINVQINHFLQFRMTNFLRKNVGNYVDIENHYSYLFSGSILKPPIF